MLRAQGVASGKRLRLRVARMPEGKDPADLLAGGDGARATRVSRRRSRRRRTCRSSTCGRCSTTPTSSSPAGRDRALDEVVEVIAAMPDSITREELMREVADRLDADPGLVARRIAAAGRAAGRRAPAPAPATRARSGAPAPRPLSARERRELALLAMCVEAARRGARVPGAAHRRALLLAGRGAGARRGCAGTSTSRPRPLARRRGAGRLRDPGDDAVRARAGEPRGDGAQLPRARAGPDRRPDPRRRGERGRAPGRAAAPPRRAHRADRPGAS